MGGRKTVGKIIGEAIGYYKRNVLLFFVTTLIVYGFVWLWQKGANYVSDLTGLAALSRRMVSPEHIKSLSTVEAYGLSGLLFLLNTAAAFVLQYVSLALTQFLSLPGGMFSINANDVMLRVSHGCKPTLREIASGFRSNWKRYLGITAWAELWSFLWFLVFIVPGIIKRINYLLAPFLVVEYPDMPVKQALKKSMEITNRHTGRLFWLSICVELPNVLIVLGSMVFFFPSQQDIYSLIVGIAIPIVGLFLVEPIKYMAFTIAYLDIKQAAIEKGLLLPDRSDTNEEELLPPEDPSVSNVAIIDGNNGI